MDFECDCAAGRYGEFEIDKGQSLDLVRDFDACNDWGFNDRQADLAQIVQRGFHLLTFYIKCEIVKGVSNQECGYVQYGHKGVVFLRSYKMLISSEKIFSDYGQTAVDRILILCQNIGGSV